MDAQSQAIVAGGTIYVSGQIPGGADGKLVEGNIGDKTAACCKNIIAILEAAGSSIERVVKVYLIPRLQLEDGDRANRIRDRSTSSSMTWLTSRR